MQGNRPIDPWSLLNTLSQRKPQNAVICTDVGQHQMWSAQHMRHFAPETILPLRVPAPWDLVYQQR